MTNANPAATLAAAMDTALLAEGYTLEDTVVIGTRTHKVYKSPAAINAEGLDWYLDLAYTTTGNGSVWMGAFETYDAVAHTAGFGPYCTSSTTVDATEFSRYGSTKYALETNWGHISNNLAQIECQTSAFTYWVSITGDRIIAMTSVNAVKVNYVGHLDPYAPWKAKVAATTPGKWNPIVTCNVTIPAADHAYGMGKGALSRVPPVAITVSWSSGGMSIRSSSSGASPSTGTSTNGGCGIGGPSGHVDTGESPYLDGGPLADTIQVVVQRSGGSTNISGWGHAAGLLYDVGRFGTSGATSVVRGDTTTVDGDPWVLASATGGACFGFKAV